MTDYPKIQLLEIEGRCKTDGLKVIGIWLSIVYFSSVGMVIFLDFNNMLFLYTSYAFTLFRWPPRVERKSFYTQGLSRNDVIGPYKISQTPLSPRSSSVIIWLTPLPLV